MKIHLSIDAVSVREIAELILSLRRMGIHDRKVIAAAIRNVIVGHTEYLGLWCVFEPEAFDGRDVDHVGCEGHDTAGRFAPRWSRLEGVLSYGCSQGHDQPVLGEWYRIARESREEVVFGPYDEEPLTGLPMLCLSRLAPIVERGRFIGAVGVDISLDTISSRRRATHQTLEVFLGRSHVFLGEDLSVQAMSPSSRSLLDRYAGSCRGNNLPQTLRSALLRQPIATGQTWTFTNTQGELMVHVMKHPHRGQVVLTLEEVAAVGRKGLFVTETISERQREVLEWVCMGKSNPEIAIILAISEHTVRHHIERIFSKLGVENRHAAMQLVARTDREERSRLVSRMPGAVGRG